MTSLFRILRPVLHALPPEDVHHLGLWLLSRGLWPAAPLPASSILSVKALGLNFANPVGLAAGFDKNACVVDALLAQGFGFVEAGTVTPLAQPGNPKPRIFRLSDDAAVINRLGFNNAGLESFVQRFAARDRSKGIAGANIGKNKDAQDAIADYLAGLRAVYAHADYITVNISSPNTQGLRALQQREALAPLLSALNAARRECYQASGRLVPLLLKVAPDLEENEQSDIAQLVLENDIDGMIISNTTISRPPSLVSAQKDEQGGLSGKPLMALSTEALKRFYRLTGGRIPLIGVGGIASAADAYAKIRAGATLVQLYTALVYQGFGVVRAIQRELPELLMRDGFTHVQQAVGADVTKA